jgi:predicted nucleotidyltransferase component of viral defense system
MDIRETPYYKQVDLLLQILPVISEIENFALKGGTAINLFLRDLPRLSVDIDLTYLPLDDRSTALENIDSHLTHIAEKCQGMFKDCQISTKQQNGLLYGLTIARSNVAVKIEPNTTIRGAVFPAITLRLCSKAQDLFGRSVEIQSLSTEDLYGGKICAALDRQHPRDLYDVYFLMKNEGLTEKVRQAFIVYLLSHNRPISELLDPQLKDNLEEVYQETFEGMTFKPFTLDDLIETWKLLIQKIKRELTDNEKKFILSIKKKAPEWDLFPIDGIQNLTAIQWKLINLDKMGKTKHKQALVKLEKVLNG